MDETAATAATEAAEPASEPITEPASEPAAETAAEAEQGQADIPGSEEVGIDADGTVRFGDSFFDGMVKDATETKAAAEPKEQEPAQTAAPQFYTTEELGRTALSDVDVKRLDPAKIGEYWDMVQRIMTGDRERIAGLEAQIAQLRAAQSPQAAQAQPTQPQQQTPPAGMSRKELTQAAAKRARELLELPEDEDLDLYDMDHQMAFAQAAQEVSAAQAQAQRMAAEQAETERFAAEVRNRADFGEFSRWFDRQLAVNGRTPEQVNASLNELVRQHGPGVIRQVVGKWYRQFRDEIGRQASAPQGLSQRRPQTAQRAQRPPVLEGAGNTPDGRNVLDFRNFGQMSPERQEQALIQMGLV